MDKRKVQSVIFYCDANNKKHFLLLKVNKRRGLFWQNSTGSVESDEKYLEAAKREAVEETGLSLNNILKVTPTSLEFSFKDQWGAQALEKVFYIHCKQQWNVELDSSEHCEFQWMIEDEFNSNILKYESNTQSVLKCMEDV